jgi:hypothetical protein
VRDVVNVLPRLLAAKCAGRVFNLGSDQPIQIRALAESARRWGAAHELVPMKGLLAGI